MNNIMKILKKEMREVFRDRKSLAMMLIIPIMIPLLVLGMSALFELQINKDPEEYNKIGFTYELSEEEKNLAQELNIEYSEGTPEEIKKSYENGEIYLYIDKDNNNFTVNYSESDDLSSFALNLADTYIASYQQMLQSTYLLEHDIDPNEVLNIVNTTYQITDEDSNYFSNYITIYAFMFIIMAITVSATYPATDTTAGEKERGTLETLLTFPIKSRDIIIGKLASVTLSSIITGLLSLILALASLAYANNIFEIYKGINIMPSISSIIVAIIIIIFYSLFISGLCIAIASMSKTFKEAQSALTPLTFISFFPSMIAFMINITTTPLLAIVPFLNFTLIFTDINAGNIDIINIMLMIISTLIYITLVIIYIIRQYKSEKILFNE